MRPALTAFAFAALCAITPCSAQEAEEDMRPPTSISDMQVSDGMTEFSMPVNNFFADHSRLETEVDDPFAGKRAADDPVQEEIDPEDPKGRGPVLEAEQEIEQELGNRPVEEPRPRQTQQSRQPQMQPVRPNPMAVEQKPAQRREINPETQGQMQRPAPKMQPLPKGKTEEGEEDGPQQPRVQKVAEEPQKRSPFKRRNIGRAGPRERKPSQAFLRFFEPWQLPVGEEVFLKTTVDELMQNHEGCRIVTTPTGKKTTRQYIACMDPRSFGSEGREVIFEFIRVNDVLVGGDYYFSTRKKAEKFVKLMKRQFIRNHVKYFNEASGNMTDSPLFAISLIDGETVGSTGTTVHVALNHRKRVEGFEHYGRLGMEKIDFGKLEIGRSNRIRIAKMATLNEEGSTKCNRTSVDDAPYDEYVGMCFQFPHEAHFQLKYNDSADVLQEVVMTPYGVLAGNLVESALTKRYGEPRLCETTKTDVRTVRTNREKDLHKPGRTERINKQKAMVFAGTCEKPIVFSVADRYIFQFDRLTIDELMNTFAVRRERSRTVTENKKQLRKREGQLEDFF